MPLLLVEETEWELKELEYDRELEEILLRKQQEYENELFKQREAENTYRELSIMGQEDFFSGKIREWRNRELALEAAEKEKHRKRVRELRELKESQELERTEILKRKEILRQERDRKQKSEALSKLQEESAAKEKKRMSDEDSLAESLRTHSRQESEKTSMGIEDLHCALLRKLVPTAPKQVYSKTLKLRIPLKTLPNELFFPTPQPQQKATDPSK